jgi:hypothetical protein
MRWPTWAGVGLSLAVLLYGTVAVFEAFDRVSHSNSDTIRPFVITMGPVWVLAIWAATVLLRKPRN